MSSTETTGEVPVQPANNSGTPPPVYMERPKRVVQFGIPMLMGTIIVVLVLGFVGGLAAQAIFKPADGHNGRQGKQGVAGPAGPAGPIGPTGSPANINLANEGLCFGSTTFTDNTGFTSNTWINNVWLNTPTVTSNGAKSCPSGSFVPLEPAPAGAAPTQ